MKNAAYLFVTLLLVPSCDGTDNGFDASGTFEAVEMIISAEVSGRLESLKIEEGKRVEQGQVLGWIDSTQLYLQKKQLLARIEAILSRRPQIATQLASYRVQLAAAERELRRVENLFRAEAATQKQVDDARVHADVIRRQMEAHRSSLDVSSQGLISETLPLYAQIEQIDDQLRRCMIANPVDGTILARYAEAHELAVPGKPLYKVADISTLELKAYITGNQLPQVKLDQQVNVYVDDGAGGYREYPGRVSWISDKAEFTPKTIQTREERANLVYAVKIPVANDGYLKIGMYGEVRL